MTLLKTLRAPVSGSDLPAQADGAPVLGGKQKAGLVTLIVVALALVPFLVDQVSLGKLQIVMYYTVAIMALTILTGRLGQISIGHGVYMGIGAYATIIANGHGVSWWFSLFLAVILAGVVGAVISLPALRISGLNLALVTLGVAVVFPQLIVKFSDQTGGATGLAAASYLPGPANITRVVWSYWVLLAVTVVCCVLAWTFVTSRTGRSLSMIRDQPIAAGTLGINNPGTKVCVYAGTAALAGIAGWMFAVVNNFAAPSDFMLALSINLVIGMIVGGATGNIVVGPVIGAVFLVYTRDAVPGLGLDPILTPVVYGSILILVIFLLPGGAASALSKLVPTVTRRVRAPK